MQIPFFTSVSRANYIDAFPGLYNGKMGILERIRKIKRPVNTVVVAYGKDKYVVRSRIGLEMSTNAGYLSRGRLSAT